MTEEEWQLTADEWWNHPVHDFSPWINYLTSFATERKLRLWAVGALRTITRYLIDERSSRAIDATERYADGNLSAAEFAVFGQQAWDATSRWQVGFETDTDSLTERFFEQSALHTAVAWAATEASVEGGLGRLIEPSIHVAMGPSILDAMHDIFGNPFRPVEFDASWRTPDVVDLARGIYEARAFEQIPLLADALMDAGCADEQVLGHCRSGGPHVRGCWVVDLVLGKE